MVQGLVLFSKSISIKVQQVLLITLLSKQVAGADAGISYCIMCSTFRPNAKAWTCAKAWIQSREAKFRLGQKYCFSEVYIINTHFRSNRGFSHWDEVLLPFWKVSVLFSYMHLQILSCDSCPEEVLHISHKSLFQSKVLIFFQLWWSFLWSVLSVCGGFLAASLFFLPCDFLKISSW